MPLFGRKSAKQKSTKSVSFTEEADAVTEIPLYPDIEEIWYTDEDELVFRERDTKMATMLLDLDPNLVELKLAGDSPRGLEYYHGEKSKQTNERRKSSRQAVIATQKLFQKQERDGTESIARAYGLCCEAAKADAVAYAKRDAQFIQDHVKKVSRVSVPMRGLSPVRGLGNKFDDENRSDRPSILGRTGARRSLAT